MNTRMKIREGDIVEDFEALDQKGTTVKLSELVTDGPVVLFFYPKASSAACTAEACHFRNLAADFEKVGARAVGISGDSVEDQADFDRRNNLGLTLLSDRDKSITTMFGAKRPGPLGAKRSTFVIGEDRRVIKIIASEFNMELHADEALAALAARRSPSSGGPGRPA